MTNDDNWCRHYRAAAHHDTCKLGIAYASLACPPLQRPCYTPGNAALCAGYEPQTAEEIAEREQWISQAVAAFARLVARESDTCPHCGRQITSMRQVGRCTYGSCGCRLFQGAVPDAWKE